GRKQYPECDASKTHTPKESHRPKRPLVKELSRVVIIADADRDEVALASSFDRSRLHIESSSVVSFLSNLTASAVEPSCTSRPSLMTSVLPAIFALPLTTA